MTEPAVTVEQFISRTRSLRDRRRGTVHRILAGEMDPGAELPYYRKELAFLTGLPRSAEGSLLRDRNGRTIAFNLDYEITSLERDLSFLQNGMNGLENELSRQLPRYREQLDRLLDLWQRNEFHHIVSDRDGTVAPYCGRYLTSVQSVYSAVQLSRLARQLPGDALLLTSAPLQDEGLRDLSVMPEGEWLLAGSKGREFLDRENTYRAAALPDETATVLKELYTGISTLLQQPQFELLGMTGSALQRKHGQITVARQDHSGSILPKYSQRFKQEVKLLLEQLDPQGQLVTLVDTGLDLELTGNSTADSEYTKGDGLNWIHRELPLPLSPGPVTVWGDTASDIPLATAARQLNAESTAVFVTRDRELLQQLEQSGLDYITVDDPAVLIGLAWHLTVDLPDHPITKDIP